MIPVESRRYISAIKIYIGFSVDDHLIRELMSFTKMTNREFV
jgi:hypothetical protein